MATNKIYRTLVIVLTFFAFAPLTKAQKTELNLNAYTGLFFFRGSGATSNSRITAYIPATPTSYTVNPYGTRSAFSYSCELQAQRVSAQKNIYGLGVGFERLKSKVLIDTVDGGDFVYFKSAATGKTSLDNTFINLNPFIGHRYLFYKIDFDLLAGTDIAFCLKSKEEGKATTNDKDYVTVKNERSKPSIDFRPRIQVKAQINKVGIIAGYSLGLTNYKNHDSSKAYSSFIRVGLSYQLR